jgi:hypothetical protein
LLVRRRERTALVTSCDRSGVKTSNELAMGAEAKTVHWREHRSLFLSFPLHLLLRGEVDTPAPTSGDSRPFELGRIDGGQRMTHTT